MLKRVLIGGSFAVIFVGLVLVYILKRTESFEPARVAEAVPSHAILFVDNLNYSYFSKEFFPSNSIWKELSLDSQFSDFDSLFTKFDTKISLYPILSKQLAEGALSVSLHLLGKSQISALFYLKLSGTNDIQSFENEFKQLLGKKAIINDRKYEAVTIQDVSLSASQVVSNLSYVIKDGLLIIGRSSILLEDAIRSLNAGGSLEDEEGFKVVEGMAGKYVHGNVYVNYSLAGQLLYPLFNSLYYSKLLPLSRLAHWGEYDADLSNELLLFNGMTYVNDSLKAWLNIFKDQTPVKLEAMSFVPSNAIQMMAAGISDTERFKEAIYDQLNLYDQLDKFEKSSKEIKAILGVDPMSELLDILSDEIALFTIDDNADGRLDEVIIYEIRSRSEAEAKLKSWVSMIAASENNEVEKYISKYQLDDQSSYEIYTLTKNIYEGTLPGRFIKSHFAFFENYLIFSDSKDAVSRTIYHNVLRKTLENDPYYSEVSNLVSSKTNLTYFIRPELFIRKMDLYLKQEAIDLLSSLSGFITKIPGVVVQFANEGDIFYSNVSLKYSSSVKEKALTVWESLLDSVAIIKPVLVTNHNTSEKEIIVQDKAGSLYLLNSTGRVLWKVKLDSPILSDIYQVDYYKNGKLQYMFNTSSGIHLIDRNGNYVERYPINLRAEASNGIVLFDYDNRKDYRIFVACKDRKVYVYNLEGNLVPGWNFKKSEGIIEKPVQHFRVQEKDYIVFSDGLRAYIVDRKGKERIKQKELLKVSKNNLFYLDMNISGDQPRLVTSDSDGNVVSLDFKGDTEVLLEKEHAASHYFLLKDLDADGHPEYIFSEGNELEVFDSKGKSLFSFKIKSDISKLPDVYQFSSSDLKIGLTDVEKNKIYLLNSDGTLYEGFPLEGCTQYSIGYFAGSDSRFNLIVGSEKGFLYNYSIE